MLCFICRAAELLGVHSSEGNAACVSFTRLLGAACARSLALSVISGSPASVFFFFFFFPSCNYIPRTTPGRTANPPCEEKPGVGSAACNQRATLPVSHPRRLSVCQQVCDRMRFPFDSLIKRAHERAKHRQTPDHEA